MVHIYITVLIYAQLNWEPGKRNSYIINNFLHINIHTFTTCAYFLYLRSFII